MSLPAISDRRITSLSLILSDRIIAGPSANLQSLIGRITSSAFGLKVPRRCSHNPGEASLPAVAKAMKAENGSKTALGKKTALGEFMQKPLTCSSHTFKKAQTAYRGMLKKQEMAKKRIVKKAQEAPRKSQKAALRIKKGKAMKAVLKKGKAAIRKKRCGDKGYYPDFDDPDYCVQAYQGPRDLAFCGRCGHEWRTRATKNLLCTRCGVGPQCFACREGRSRGFICQDCKTGFYDKIVPPGPPGRDARFAFC